MSTLFSIGNVKTINQFRKTSQENLTFTCFAKPIMLMKFFGLSFHLYQSLTLPWPALGIAVLLQRQ